MLTGLKILDLTSNLPGPYATMLLADLGAEVLKVERPPAGDPLRHPPGCTSGESPRFQAINRRKKSVTLDLKTEVGKSILINLLAEYDIVFEGFRPGVMDSLGLGYAELKKHRPDLIYVALTGYGQDGPWRQRSGHDLNYQAVSGLLALSGKAGDGPMLPGFLAADLAGGTTMALLGLLSAVIHRRNTGQGCFVDAAMFDGVISMASFALSAVFGGEDAPVPGGGLLTGRLANYNIYSTADDRYMSLAALEPQFWQNFCTAVDRTDLLGRADGGPEAVEEVAGVFAAKTRDEWVELLADVDCCCEPVLDPAEAAVSPQAKARNMTWAVQGDLPPDENDPDDDGEPREGKPFYQAGVPVRFSCFEPSPPRPTPYLGRDNLEVLTNLGYSEDEVDELVEAGVV